MSRKRYWPVMRSPWKASCDKCNAGLRVPFYYSPTGQERVICEDCFTKLEMKRALASEMYRPEPGDPRYL